MPRPFHLTGILLLASSAVLSQASSASFSGTVTDAAGFRLTRATVTLENSATHAVRRVQSNASGVFALPELPAGTYQLRVETPASKRKLKAAST